MKSPTNTTSSPCPQPRQHHHPGRTVSDVVGNLGLRAAKKEISEEDLFRGVDHEPERIRETKHRLETDYAHAFSLYADGRMAEALRAYDDLIERAGKHTYLANTCADQLLHFYRNRCEAIARSFEAGIADPDKWEGVYEFTEK